MKKERSAYRHPKHDDIAELVLQGMKDCDVAEQLGTGRRAVARVRDILGVEPRVNGTSREEKLARFSVVQDDGHTGWTGRRTKSGTPSIRHRGIEIPASHVAFEQRTGRPPVGIVKAECGTDRCLTPAHVSDELERRDLRMKERSLAYLPPQPWDICSKGTHTWDEGGRIQPDLTPYCCACNTERVLRSRQWKAEEESTV